MILYQVTARYVDVKLEGRRRMDAHVITGNVIIEALRSSCSIKI